MRKKKFVILGNLFCMAVICLLAPRLWASCGSCSTPTTTTSTTTAATHEEVLSEFMPGGLMGPLREPITESLVVDSVVDDFQLIVLGGHGAIFDFPDTFSFGFEEYFGLKKDGPKKSEIKETIKRTKVRDDGSRATSTYIKGEDGLIRLIKQEYTYPDGTTKHINHYSEDGGQINAIFFRPDGCIDYINVFEYGATDKDCTVKKMTFSEIDRGLIKAGVIKTDAYGMPVKADPTGEDRKTKIAWKKAIDKAREADNKAREAREAEAKSKKAAEKMSEALNNAMDAEPGSDEAKKAGEEVSKAAKEAKNATEEAKNAKEEAKKASDAAKKAIEEAQKASEAAKKR